MTYNHLTPTELVMIEAYFNQSQPVSKVLFCGSSFRSCSGIR
ncbi:hypothetical protein [Enterococcus sp. DIV1317a]